MFFLWINKMQVKSHCIMEYETFNPYEQKYGMGEWYSTYKLACLFQSKHF